MDENQKEEILEIEQIESEGNDGIKISNDVVAVIAGVAVSEVPGDLEEGIREPIKVYEYMNRFYVEEGNKRVSVLKFFGAVTIPAQVIRILPPKGEAPELKRYYEFLDFYRICSFYVCISRTVAL